MFEPVFFVDALFSPWLAPLWRISLWAVISAVASMWLYARIAPQEKILSLKQQQKTSRQQLLGYDGEWEEMKTLILHNLSVSFRLLGITLLPVLIATVPVVWIMLALYETYDQPLVGFGPDWMRGFDFWYIIILLAISIAIKIKCKIA